MLTQNDVHQQFAEYFREPSLKPYLYTLSKKMGDGHICIHINKIEMMELPDPYRNIMEKDGKLKSLLIAKDDLAYRPFVLDNDRFYLQRYFQYETQLLRRIVELIKTAEHEQTRRMEALLTQESLIKELFRNNSAGETDWQLVAAITAVLNNFTIITGGPGTGKTTTVAKILAILFSLYPEMKVALAAPTGKAGARMAESLVNTQVYVNEDIRDRFYELKPTTIHRLLGWQKNTPYFKHNADHPLPYDLVIVDESSMIDVALFAKLLDAVGPDTRIILLGDKDQLASVEAGSLFGDLCKAQPTLNLFEPTRRHFINIFIFNGEHQLQEEHEIKNKRHPLFQHLVELRYSHRFKDDEGIGKFSHAVIHNDIPALYRFLKSNGTTRVQIDQEYSASIFEQFIEGYKEYIDTPDIKIALEKLNSMRILCAVRQGERGVYMINASVEAHLIKAGKLKKDSEFYEHRPIIITQNNYTLGLYNGDIGILRQDEKGVIKAWFTDNTKDNITQLKSVLPGFITHMETVFAMTIHKSQGSEFNKVMIVLPQNTEHQLLTRELLYTAITRAKNEVVIQVNAEVLLAAAEGVVERGSGVAERLDNYT